MIVHHDYRRINKLLDWCDLATEHILLAKTLILRKFANHSDGKIKTLPIFLLYKFISQEMDNNAKIKFCKYIQGLGLTKWRSRQKYI